MFFREHSSEDPEDLKMQPLDGIALEPQFVEAPGNRVLIRIRTADDASLCWRNHDLVTHNYLVVHPTNRKWVITPVISGLTLLIPFITGVITHLLSGMNHQVRTTTHALNLRTSLIDVLTFWHRNLYAWLCLARNQSSGNRSVSNMLPNNSKQPPEISRNKEFAMEFDGIRWRFSTWHGSRAGDDRFWDTGSGRGTEASWDIWDMPVPSRNARHKPYGCVWKCWVNIPNEIAIFS